MGGTRNGAVMRALISHQCGQGLIPGLNVTCGLSLLLVLIPVPRIFLHVLWFSSLHKNQHFQIPILPGNSGEKSQSVDSTEIHIILLLLIYYMATYKRIKTLELLRTLYYCFEICSSKKKKSILTPWKVIRNS